jgi:hypothetical protein
MVLENWVLRRIFGPIGRKGLEAGDNCIMRSFMTSMFQKTL